MVQIFGLFALEQERFPEWRYLQLPLFHPLSEEDDGLDIPLHDVKLYDSVDSPSLDW